MVLKDYLTENLLNNVTITVRGRLSKDTKKDVFVGKAYYKNGFTYSLDRKVYDSQMEVFDIKKVDGSNITVWIKVNSLEKELPKLNKVFYMDYKGKYEKAMCVEHDQHTRPRDKTKFRVLILDRYDKERVKDVQFFTKDFLLTTDWAY